MVLALELVKDSTLLNYCAQQPGGKIPEAEAAPLFREVIAGVAYSVCPKSEGGSLVSGEVQEVLLNGNVKGPFFDERSAKGGAGKQTRDSTCF